MDTKDAIRAAINFSSMVYNGYIADLDDAELMSRPGEGCNHLAWQTGHLISSEAHMLEGICPGKGVSLPDGFAEAHSKENAGSDDPANFKSKDEYVALMEQVRGATLKALDEIPDADLDDPSPDYLRDLCPTVGQVFVLIATHPMMHAGQAVPLRRKFGKPVLF